MAFVGQSNNPWDVPVKQAVKVMQKIWDAISGHEYEIMTPMAVYQKVCDHSSSRTILISIFQTVQHLADSWRNVIGSTGIAIILAFFDSQENLQDSDHECQEFTTYYLEDLHFLYRNSSHDNKKVHNYICHSMSSNNTILRNGRGSFAAPSSYRPLQHTLWLSKVLRRFLASMILMRQLPQLLVL